MNMQALAGAAGLCAAAFAVSALFTRLAIAYAHHRGMLDQPGFRRSHTLPTPRGGGIGLVMGALPAVALALGWWPGSHDPVTVIALCVAGVMVAFAGWADDHRGMGVLPRLLIQFVAAVFLMAALLADAQLNWLWLPVGVFLAVWSINLHNFMDGIDGILGLQVLFVGTAWGVLATHAGQAAVALAAFGMAAAAAGFLLFNWPPARIFMGDVGSGFAGFLVFALLVMLCVRVRLALWPALILCSAFVADASLTLAWRMWRGKRWYSAHREHLYQWLARCGFNHMQTGFIYMAWNLLLAAPLAAWAYLRPQLGPWLCLILYGVAACTWWQGRRICMARRRYKGAGHLA